MSTISAQPSKSLGNSSIIIDDSEKVVRPQDEKIAGVVNDVLQAQPEKVENIDKKPIPALYEELRAKGYIHLYNHLVRIKGIPCEVDRKDANKVMDCFSTSRVIEETRKAIIKRVEDAIPADHKNVVFLLGESTVGMSTALCFLRGDEMALDGMSLGYVSKSDTDGLIRDNWSESYTLLPNIAIVGELAIVDYPGFYSDYGPTVAFAMELALKELIGKYHPKILALYPITWGGPHSLADRFGSTLERLFENNKCCMVGFTLYSKNNRVITIKKIEEEPEELKRQESKIKKEFEELEPYVDVNRIREFKQQIQDDLAEVNRKIADLQQKKAAAQQVHRSVIKATEKELLCKMRLEGEPLRFDNLEDQNLLSSCLETLSKPAEEEIRLNPEKKLDSAHQALLDQLAKEALSETMARNKWPVKKEDIEAFEQRIVDSSLFAAILSCSNPEMGELLHLPEIDSSIVRNFDGKIISHCINEYEISIINLLDEALFNEEFKTRAEAESEKIAAMMSKKIVETLSKKIIEAIPTEQREYTEKGERDRIAQKASWCKKEITPEQIAEKASRKVEKMFAELTADRVTAVMKEVVPEELAKMTAEEVVERVKIMMPRIMTCEEVAEIIYEEMGATVSEARAEMPSWNGSAAFSEEKVKALKEKINQAFDFIFASSPRDPEEPKKSWKAQRKPEQGRYYKTEQRRVPGWARDYLGLQVPNDIFNALNSKLSPSNREENDRMIDTACNEIEKMFSAQEKLKQIEGIVDARAPIRRA